MSMSARWLGSRSSSIKDAFVSAASVPILSNCNEPVGAFVSGSSMTLADSMQAGASADGSG